MILQIKGTTETKNGARSDDLSVEYVVDMNRVRLARYESKYQAYIDRHNTSSIQVDITEKEFKRLTKIMMSTNNTEKTEKINKEPIENNMEGLEV